uniref:C3H1-type domain-containing protein n=1 Tax=Romanomermis culicivorax TaxID=13658 RepID=A0A915JLY3_ROMCU
MAATAASMVFNMPMGPTFMMSNVLPLEHASYNSSVAPKMPVNLAAVAYYDETGQLLDTLPVCRDFKQGHCDRPSCRYVHLYEEYVEVSDGKVTVCRDFAKGKCVRSTCKYYHIPLFFNHSLQTFPDTVNATIIPNPIIQPAPTNHHLSLCQSTNPLVYQVLQQDNHLGDVLYNQSS